LADKQAKLTVGGKDFDLPVLDGTTGPEVVDIRKLYAQTGMFTYDPGYTSTASCESALTYIDGNEACCSIAATRSARSPSSRASWKSRTCC
jgi:citrate synthase